MNNTSAYELTIVVPVYNEQANMEQLEQRLAAFLSTASVSACILLVNDGSKDDSLQRMKEMCRRNKDFYYISFDENRGLSTAMKAGIDTAQSKYVGYIDSDLQTDPDDFNLLLKYAPRYQLV